MLIQKINQINYDIEKINLEISKIVEQHDWSGPGQISLQSPNGDFGFGIGKIEDTKGYNEENFNLINTPEDWEITKFIKNNNLYRTRIMKLKPKSTYTMHWDRSPRVHLATVTSENCFLVLENKLHHIPNDGFAYWVDTRVCHSAVNFTPDLERIHLVGCQKF